MNVYKVSWRVCTAGGKVDHHDATYNAETAADAITQWEADAGLYCYVGRPLDAPPMVRRRHRRRDMPSDSTEIMQVELQVPDVDQQERIAVALEHLADHVCAAFKKLELAEIQLHKFGGK